MPSTFPHIHHESQGSVTADDKMLKTFPEVHHVFGKIGRAETQQTLPVNDGGNHRETKTREQWPDPAKPPGN